MIELVVLGLVCALSAFNTYKIYINNKNSNELLNFLMGERNASNERIDATTQALANHKDGIESLSTSLNAIMKAGNIGEKK